jgi:hypothetical protein
MCTDRALIAKAWTSVVQSHRSREWPVAGVLCKAIAETRGDSEDPNPGMPRLPKPAGRHGAELDRYMRTITSTPDGQDALMAGHGLLLQDDLKACVINGPSDLTPRYLASLHARQQRFNAALVDARNLQGKWAAPVIRLGEDMAERQRTLALRYGMRRDSFGLPQIPETA